MNRSFGLKAMLSFLILTGITMTVASIMFIKSGMAMTIWVCVGLGLIVIAGAGLIFSNLYVIARGNLAFFKTGSGGSKVIKDTGTIVIGFLHHLTPVSLETMKIVVEKKDKEALITKGGLRAEIAAEFYIRVRADEGGIETAARRLGDKISSALSGYGHGQQATTEALTRIITELEKEKLVDALRTIAGTKTLEELNLQRTVFKKDVMDVVKDGLEQNGLELEDVTISHLDQARKDTLDPNNAFDAEGLMNLAEKTSAYSIKQNEFEREAELQIKKRNVETESAVLQQDRDLALRTADQNKEIRTYTAEQEKEAALVEIRNQEETAKRDIEKNRAVELAEVEKGLQTKQARVAAEQATTTAEVAKQKAIEIANREREIAIAAKEKEKANAEALRLAADKEKEAAAQAVQTTRVLAEAERDKDKAIVEEQADAEKSKIKSNMAADVAAYAQVKEAEAAETAAIKKAAATIKEAEAGKSAKVLEAEGDRAKQMIPIEVEAKKVEVEQKRVEVLQQELKAKSDNIEVVKGLEIEISRITASKEVGIAFAKALGEGISSANMTIWGGPDTVARISEAFTRGQTNGQFLSGLLESTPPRVVEAIEEVKDGAVSALDGFGSMIGGLVKKVTGKDVDSATIAAILEAVQKEQLAKTGVTAAGE